MALLRQFDRLFCVTLIGVFLVCPAYAAAVDFDDTTDFDFYLRRLDTALDKSRPMINTTVEQVGISIYSPLNSMIDGALIAGYSFVSQENAVLTAGMNLSGAHLGLAFRTQLYRRAGTLMSLDIRYLYQNIDDALNNQSVRLVWHSYDTGLSITHEITPLFGIDGAIRYGGANGTETASGTVTQTRSFDSESKTEGVAGIHINTGEGGKIALYAHSGMHDGVELVFSREY